MSAIHIEHLPELLDPGLHRLGRHVEHDERSRDYAITAPAKLDLAAVLHERFGGPFTQSIGSCTGNAMAGWCNTAPKGSPHALLLTETDAVRLYSAATHLDRIKGFYPPDDTGSSGLAVCKAALREGRISAYHHAFSIHAALWALQAAPVITGVPWYTSFDAASGTTPVAVSGTIRGGHEFLVVGFEPVGSDYLDGIVTAWNSWGKAWGDGGRFYFTARTWGELLAQRGDVTCPVP